MIQDHKSMYQPRGPGAELKQLLAGWGFKERKGCRCNAYAAAMNVNGNEWCRANTSTIIAWLKGSAEERRLPFSRIVARSLLNKAIARSEGMVNLETAFDAVYCINLGRRKDRWRAFKKQVPADWPFKPIKRVEAIDGKKIVVPDWWNQGGGAWGCYRTHLRLIEDAMNRGVNSILLLEDDAVFCEGFTEKVAAYINALPRDWGMVYFGGQHLFVNAHPPLKVNELVYRPYNVNRTHAYGIRGEKMMRTVYRHLNRTDDWQRYNHIDHHLGRLHQRRQDPIYTPAEWLVGQGADKSNICGREQPERFWPTANQITKTDPASQPVVAVLGLHSSGSSCVAGVLHHLGFHLGNQLGGYYGKDPEKNCGFEAIGLAQICEAVVPFPTVGYKVQPSQIWRRLRTFLNQKRREAANKGTIAALKYPQLCQMGRQLLNLLEHNLHVVVVDRPFEDSLESILKRCPDKDAKQIELHQQWLQEGREWLIDQVSPEQVIRIDYYELLSEPRKVVTDIVNRFASFNAPFTRGDRETEERLARAMAWPRAEKQHVRKTCESPR